jgi:subtilase family serine protease
MVASPAARQQNDWRSDPNIVTPATTLPQPKGYASTNHLIYAKGGIAPNASSPQGLVPAQMRAAYGVTTNGSGAIAIVDAYHYNTSLNDFNAFSNQFGLPTEPSTDPLSSSNTRFQVVYASGKKPRADSGWALEAAMDIEWAHAMAPNAKIYLVEAASNSLANLVAANNVAKALVGVKQVSNSWGGSESSSAYSSYDSTFVQNGVAFYASGGDTGGAKEWPSLSFNVVGVGGTTLTMSGNSRVNEVVWNGTGCGLSSYESRPSFQDSIQSIVGSHRGADDIAADADPNTGASVYTTTSYQGFNGWLVVAGTSLACPVIAGCANASGTNRSSSQAQNAAFYGGIGGPNFHDITSGSAGSFSAQTGWDYPTGVGTPNGLGGF